MERISISYLESWLAAPDRKPLVIRGARQVGKTWLVRRFASLQNRELIELNFEKQPDYAALFESNHPEQVLKLISAALNLSVNPQECLLFLDEIQAAPHLLAKLRWFAEDMPQLPVIAAGSLLEFVLADHSFSMPVGRISYMHLEPLSFEEFLLALDQKQLATYLTEYEFDSAIPDVIHEQLSRLFREYLFFGGMPAVISNWATTKSLENCQRIKHDLLATYRDDFTKYRGRLQVERLEEVMVSVPAMLGHKFVFSHVNKDVQASSLKSALQLLERAKITYPVRCVAANGVPLAAEIRQKHFKEIFIDVGLCSTVLGLNLYQIDSIRDISTINNGGLAEQVAGQLLRTQMPAYVEPTLYYWHREETGSNAEIDYVIQYEDQVIPVEVKAGSAGGLKSLHLFMKLKKIQYAVRINSHKPEKIMVDVKSGDGSQIKYQLLSIPFYLTGQLNRLLDGWIHG